MKILHTTFGNLGLCYLKESTFVNKNSFFLRNSLTMLVLLATPQPTPAVIHTTVVLNTAFLSVFDVLFDPIVKMETMVFETLLRFLVILIRFLNFVNSSSEKFEATLTLLREILKLLA